MLAFEQVTYCISGKPLVAGIDATVTAGEWLALLGPNGAGKSTLLGLATGQLHPTQGKVRLQGREIPAWTLQELARQRAWLGQQPQLSFPFSGYEVVAMGREPHQSRQRCDQAIIERLLDVLEVQSIAQAPYTRLSGGEQQRLQLARVLAQVMRTPEKPVDGACLLLDEPLNHLDLKHQLAIMMELDRLRQEGAMILTVLHDINLAARYATRLWLMQQGQCVADGVPQDVLQPARIQEVFGVMVEPANSESGRWQPLRFSLQSPASRRSFLKQST